jgi:hypothetical protein
VKAVDELLKVCFGPITGKLMVRINGTWLEVQPAATARRAY